MSYLPQSTKLGKLELIEVYEFYDKPLLFSCRNEDNDIFLAVFIDENENFDTWLYTKMSSQRFTQVWSGEIDLHDAFAKAEKEVIFEVQIPYDNEQPIAVKTISSSLIHEEWLPLPGQFVETSTPLSKFFSYELSKLEPICSPVMTIERVLMESVKPPDLVPVFA